jgi:hypothetical protein
VIIARSRPSKTRIRTSTLASPRHEEQLERIIKLRVCLVSRDRIHVISVASRLAYIGSSYQFRAFGQAIGRWTGALSRPTPKKRKFTSNGKGEI